MVKVGIIADVQYADSDDAWDFHHTVLRRYRHASTVLRRSVKLWCDQDVRTVVNLGDLIDGRNRDIPNAAQEALDSVMMEFDTLSTETQLFHLIGNHDLYNFDRISLETGIPTASSNSTFKCSDFSKSSPYYSFRISDNWVGIVLDTFDVSPLRIGGGRLGKELTFDQANVCKVGFDAVQSHNPNDLTKFGVDFFQNVKPGLESRWVPFNGGIGQEQLRWLQETLTDLPSSVNVVVFSHVVIHPLATPYKNCRSLLWNYEDVLAILKSTQHTKLVLTGHAHEFALHIQQTDEDIETGLVEKETKEKQQQQDLSERRVLASTDIAHVTFPSPLETGGDDCCAILELERGFAHLKSFGFQDLQFIIQ